MCFLYIFLKICVLKWDWVEIQMLFSIWQLLSYMGLLSKVAWGSCFCLLPFILSTVMHPLAVFLLLQQELHSVVQFLNDLISSVFPFFLYSLLSPVGLLHHHLLFLSYSAGPIQAFGSFLASFIVGKMCFLASLCWLKLFRPLLPWVFDFIVLETSTERKKYLR